MRKVGVKAPTPGFIEPQLATLKAKPPKGDYLHEIKFDGYRAQVHLVRGSAKIFTRSGLDWTRRFGPIVDALDHDVNAILDGEIVVVEDTRPNFSLLQQDLADGLRDRLSLYLFDIFFLDGRDLRKEPLIERKAVLENLCKKFRSPVFYSRHFEVDADDLFERARRMNLEGIISKRTSGAYKSGRTDDWVKVKCVQKARFPVVGFIPDVGALSRQEGRQGAGLRGEGRLRLLAEDLDVGSQEARGSGGTRAEADAQGAQPEGEVGGTDACRRGRVPRHHC